MPPIRILVVDDSPTFLSLVAYFLATDPQITIVGVAHSGREALEQVPRVQPDLVLMDVCMPELDGLTTTRLIKAQSGAPRIVLWTAYQLPEYRASAEVVGADDFLNKANLVTQLLPCIHALCDALPPDAPGT